MLKLDGLCVTEGQKMFDGLPYDKQLPDITKSQEGSIETSSEKILVIIDMQPHFIRYIKPPENLHMLVNSILSQIEKAKSKSQTIVVVEFEVKPIGPDSKADDVFTDIRIMDALAGYQKTIRVRKKTDSASVATKEGLDSLNIKPKKVTVCGVNTNYCVKHTVETLINVIPTIKKITVPENACGQNEGMVDSWSEHREGIKAMSRLPNVKVKKDDAFEALRMENRIRAIAKEQIK